MARIQKYSIMKSKPSGWSDAIPDILKGTGIMIVTATSFIAAAIGLCGLISTTQIVTVTLLFLFGCYAVIQAHTLGTLQHRITLGKQENKYVKKAFLCLHEITEHIRNYRTYKNYIHKTSPETTLGRDMIHETYLKPICALSLSKYLNPKYGDELTLCIKYKFGQQMCSVRDGNLAENRSRDTEAIDDSNLFLFLTQTKRSSFIQINDTNDDKELIEIFGDTPLVTLIKQRAERQGYRSLIALVINTGEISTQPPSTPPKAKGQDPIVKSPLGFIGIDSPLPNAFDNFREHEYDFLAVITDATSELLWDIQQLDENTNPTSV